MFLVIRGRHSDKTNERRWHIAIPIGITAIALIVEFTTKPIVVIGAVNDATGSIYGGLVVIATVCIVALVIILCLRFNNEAANKNEERDNDNVKELAYRSSKKAKKT